MKQMHKLAIAAAMTLAFSGLAQAGADKAAYDKAAADAKAAQKEASSVGGEWRDIGGTLKDADKEAAAGNYDKAVKLANKAKEQAELGVIQAKAQANAGPPF